MDPEKFYFWFLIIGVLLTVMALAGSVLKRLPLSATLLYLGTGLLVGPLGLGLLVVDPLGEGETQVVERLAEVVVVLSLFAAGLKMRTPLTAGRWWLPIRLASLSMVVTVALVAVVAYYILGLPLGGAVLLGAVLAPTDPVLASDVQLERPEDEDRLRFTLTGEAGFNDGAAFPFVMLGLGLLGLPRESGEAFTWWSWVVYDLLWAVPAGLAVGAVLGAAMGYLVVYLRREHKEAVGLDDFLALGLVSLSYGVALWIGSWAFLAAFSAGVALREVERRHSEKADTDTPGDVTAAAEQGEKEEMATHPEHAPAYMASAVMGFTERFERIGSVMMVVLVGAMLGLADFTWRAWVFVPLLLFVIRPVAVVVGLMFSNMKWHQRGLISWFGIRGIGSVYYLMYAEAHGLDDGVAGPILALTLATIAASSILHGISVTPLMGWYGSGEDENDEGRMANEE